MKNFFSIFFLVIYLAGFLQPSWTLVDFYMNRDDFTQKFCVNLDKGISQCRASCYLEKLLDEEQSNNGGVYLSMVEKFKIIEYSNHQRLTVKPDVEQVSDKAIIKPAKYLFDFSRAIFHPPKA